MGSGASNNEGGGEYLSSDDLLSQKFLGASPEIRRLALDPSNPELLARIRAKYSETVVRNNMRRLGMDPDQQIGG